jgi:hypothetical protein
MMLMHDVPKTQGTRCPQSKASQQCFFNNTAKPPFEVYLGSSEYKHYIGENFK